MGKIGFLAGPAVGEWVGPGAVAPVGPKKLTGQDCVGGQGFLRVPAVALAGEAPGEGRDIVGEPDGIAEFRLEGRDSAVGLDVFGVAVFAPGIVGVDLCAASEGRPKLMQ